MLITPFIIPIELVYGQLKQQFGGYGVYAAIKAPLKRHSVHEKKSDTEQLPTGRRILLAEDNPINQEIAADLLRMHGAKVKYVDNGEKTVNLITTSRSNYFIAILMDIQIPVMDGHEASRKILASVYPCAVTIPISAITPDAFSDDIFKAQNIGKNGYITKPINVGLPLDTLQDTLTFPYYKRKLT